MEVERVVDAERPWWQNGVVRKGELGRRFEKFWRRRGFVKQKTIVQKDLRFPVAVFVCEFFLWDDVAMLGKTDGSVHVWLQCLDKREIIAFLFRRRIIMIGWRIIIDFEIGDGQ